MILFPQSMVKKKVYLTHEKQKTPKRRLSLAEQIKKKHLERFHRIMRNNVYLKETDRGLYTLRGEISQQDYEFLIEICKMKFLPNEEEY